MLRVFQLSGEEVISLEHDAVENIWEKKHGNSIRALKWHLQPAFGVSIYRLKLIDGNVPLDDACPLLSLLGKELVLTLVAFHQPTDEETELFLSAAKHGLASELEVFLQLPIDPNGVFVPEEDDNLTEFQMSALVLAADSGREEAVELLLDAGANIEHTNTFDETALHMASYRGHVQVVDCLLSRKAPTDNIDTEGRRPLDVAISQHREAVVALLLETRAPLPDPPLHGAVESGSVGIVALLIQAKAAGCGRNFMNILMSHMRDFLNLENYKKTEGNEAQAKKSLGVSDIGTLAPGVQPTDIARYPAQILIAEQTTLCNVGCIMAS
eukprot:Skav218526  [mRNA]  locus=scaffold2478:281348:282967:- [translate_table: standard]